MSVGKTVLGVLQGFLAHHTDDLNAVASSLDAILSALPVNAETRANIDALISRVKTSADNITQSLDSLATTAAEPVTVKESDIETAVRNVIVSGALDKALGDAVRSYMLANPPATVTAEPAPAPATATVPVVGSEGVQGE